ncbi:MAG: tetratricopeptide repeat protein [Clostridium perfringens]|nr:tetratricopeptide repeat protein [Clostridium perfringens]
MKKEVIIDAKIGRVTRRCKKETVILKGDYPYNDSKFTENCKIVIKNDEGNKEYSIGVSGYNFKLFIGNFSGRHVEDIFVCGETGGSGGYVIGILYKYSNDELKEIFNGNNFFNEYNCKAKYLDYYKVNIICNSYKKEYTLDISDKGKEVLESIYDGDGKVITNENPTVSYMNKIEVVSILEDNLLKLQIYERIIGSNNSQTLGYIRKLVSFNDSGYKVIEQDVVTKGKNIITLNDNNIKHKIEEYIPKGGVIIALNTGNDFITKDIDNNGKLEILCEYKLEGDTYLAVFREENGIMSELDVLKGEGYNISDLIIMPLEGNINKIIIGWQIGGIWSELNILEFKDNKFKELLTGNKIYYSKMEIVKYKSDGEIEIALWSHVTGEAFDVKLYSLRADALQESSKHDKEYFVRVYKYYKNIVDNSKDEAKYLFYYLANAAYKIGKKQEAIIYINKALKYPDSVASIKDLKNLESKIKE